VARRYGGLKVDQARRLKDLERENQRLKKAVSELTLDKLIASNVDTCTGCHLWRPAGVLMPRNCKGAGNGTWFLIPLACMSPIDRRRGIEAQKSTDLRVAAESLQCAIGAKRVGSRDNGHTAYCYHNAVGVECGRRALVRLDRLDNLDGDMRPITQTASGEVWQENRGLCRSHCACQCQKLRRTGY
jgi:hypothetical protein